MFMLYFFVLCLCSIFVCIVICIFITISPHPFPKLLFLWRLCPSASLCYPCQRAFSWGVGLPPPPLLSYYVFMYCLYIVLCFIASSKYLVLIFCLYVFCFLWCLSEFHPLIIFSISTFSFLYFHELGLGGQFKYTSVVAS